MKKGIILFDFKDFLNQGINPKEPHDIDYINKKQVHLLNDIHEGLNKERLRRLNGNVSVPFVETFLPTGDGYYFICKPDLTEILDISMCTMALLKVKNVESYIAADIGEIHTFKDMTGMMNVTGYAMGKLSRLVAFSSNAEKLIVSKELSEHWCENGYFEIEDPVYSGIEYPAAPFNGWYMETEIGSRNFGDVNRYNMLPVIAEKLNLNRKSKTNLWKDRALIELNRAVLHSFKKAGIRITDHHTASKQFMQFCKKEEQSGREVMADWSWIVPPMSGSSMDVFHNMWANNVKEPNFYYQDSPWNPKGGHDKTGCPFHISTANLMESK